MSKVGKISIRVHQNLKEVLNERASLEGRSLSDLICLLLACEMKRWRGHQDAE